MNERVSELASERERGWVGGKEGGREEALLVYIVLW